MEFLLLSYVDPFSFNEKRYCELFLLFIEIKDCKVFDILNNLHLVNILINIFLLSLDLVNIFPVETALSNKKKNTTHFSIILCFLNSHK